MTHERLKVGGPPPGGMNVYIQWIEQVNVREVQCFHCELLSCCPLFSIVEVFRLFLQCPERQEILQRYYRKNLVDILRHGKGLLLRKKNRISWDSFRTLAREFTSLFCNMRQHPLLQ